VAERLFSRKGARTNDRGKSPRGPLKSRPNVPQPQRQKGGRKRSCKKKGGSNREPSASGSRMEGVVIR